ncbi:helix-turn-helix domain-containing protein [Oceanobacter mangrovi]|uniref:helix-turn-helix domain-containing protein n=1 Tax=Oceanobacter mangrovi TaxID=2862510 RepID=UPI001C8DDEB9|nr:AraC family transcriptional regulator [Oceanobacter mangrovi]
MQPGFYQRSYSHEQHRHSHDYCQLVLPVTGTLEMEIDQQQGLVQAGSQLAVVKAGQQHAFAAAGDNRFLVLDLALDQQQLKLQPLPAFISLHPGLAGYIQCLDHQFQQATLTPGLQWQMSSLLLELLPTPAVSLTDASAARRIAQVRRWIDQHYAEPLDVNQLARTVHWSSRQLLAQFQLQLGQSLRDYQLGVRMWHGRQLLQQSGASVQQIAEQLGYSEPTAFSHRFRQQTGLSPRQYRQQFRN